MGKSAARPLAAERIQSCLDVQSLLIDDGDDFDALVAALRHWQVAATGQEERADLAEARDGAERLLEQTARVSHAAQRMDIAKSLFGSKRTPAEEREQLAACLRTLSSLLRDLGLLGTGADPSALANADLQDTLARLSGSFDTSRSLRAFAAVDRALGALERNAGSKVVADWLVLQL